MAANAESEFYVPTPELHIPPSELLELASTAMVAAWEQDADLAALLVSDKPILPPSLLTAAAAQDLLDTNILLRWSKSGTGKTQQNFAFLYDGEVVDLQNHLNRPGYWTMYGRYDGQHVFNTPLRQQLYVKYRRATDRLVVEAVGKLDSEQSEAA